MKRLSKGDCDVSTLTDLLTPDEDPEEDYPEWWKQERAEKIRQAKLHIVSDPRNERTDNPAAWAARIRELRKKRGLSEGPENEKKKKHALLQGAKRQSDEPTEKDE